MDQKDTKILNADNIAKYWWIIDYLVSKTIKRRSLFSWVPTTCVFLKIRENALILYGHNSLFIVKKNKIKHYLFSFLCLKLCLHWFMPFLFIFNRSLLVILNWLTWLKAEFTNWPIRCDAMRAFFAIHSYPTTPYASSYYFSSCTLTKYSRGF